MLQKSGGTVQAVVQLEPKAGQAAIPAVVRAQAECAIPRATQLGAAALRHITSL